MQGVQRVGGLLDKRKEGQGLLGKISLPSSSLHWETGEGCSGRRRPWAGGPGQGEKREGGARDRFPAAARPGAVQGDLATEAVGQRAAEALGRRPRGAEVSKREGKSITGLRGSD